MTKSKAELYGQCYIEQAQEECIDHRYLDRLPFDMCWIPLRFCKEGKVIRIDGKHGTWTVVESYGVIRDREFIDGLRTARKRYEGVIENA